MSSLNCEACSNLQSNSASFIQNGVTTAICNSLANDTGLNPNLSPLHTNCEDLNDVNDCLIGRMDAEIEAYDVCEWREYMHKFVGNEYETNKALICSDCGQWTNIHVLDDRLDQICRILDNILSPPVIRYGTLPNVDADAATARRCGTLGQKSGSNIMIPMPESAVNPNNWPAQNVGVRYGRQTITACSSGRCRMYEWISPDFYAYYIGSSASVGAGGADGDVLWSVTKSVAQSKIGVSDHLWQVFTDSGYTWTDYSLSDHRYGWFKLRVVNDVLRITYEGTSYSGEPGSARPTNVIISDTTRVATSDNPHRLYRHFCS